MKPRLLRTRLRTAVVALLVAAVEPAAAQGPRVASWPRPRPFVLVPSPRTSIVPLQAGATWPASAARLPLGDSVAIAPTLWKTGAIVGGTVFGVAGASAAWGLCHEDDPCRAPIWPTLAAFVLAGGLGVAVGALIGGQIPAGAP